MSERHPTENTTNYKFAGDDLYRYNQQVEMSPAETLGFVATKPFENTRMEVVIKNGVATTKQKSTITALDVVLPCELRVAGRTVRLSPGDTVFVSTENTHHVWASKVIVLEDRSFILIPQDSVCMIKTR